MNDVAGKVAVVLLVLMFFVLAGGFYVVLIRQRDIRNDLDSFKRIC